MPEVAGSSPVGRPTFYILLMMTNDARNIITCYRNLIPFASFWLNDEGI